nr:RagB/SusD family nutrient uptake outer membrane protein [Segetibacter sp.]
MNHLRYTAFIVLLVASVSCKKDFLQRDPGVAITEDKVFEDPLLAYRFADNTYNYLLDDYGRLSVNQAYKGNTSQFSDESILADAITAHGVLTMNQGKFLDDASSDVGRVYTRMYQGIRNANIMLSRVDSVPDAPAIFNASLVKAQQFFLRAFFYFELVKRFGGVILLDKPLSSKDELDLPRNTYEETVAFILKDLQEAEALLSTETWQSIYNPDNGWNAQNNN